jgi:ADP-heptose:LPS heptosyltransferase
MKTEYLIKNKKLLFFIKMVNFFYFFLKKRKIKDIKNPKKIILCNLAHLGDVLISCAVIPVIKNKYPDAQIDFICFGFSKEIAQNQKYIKNVFVLDHFKLNREKISFFKKIKKYFISKKKILKVIKNEKYDISIDLYQYFPNLAYFFYKAKIPIRIGFSSSGFDVFLTHFLDFKGFDYHINQYHADLLKFLDIKNINHLFLKPIFKEDFFEKEKKEENYFVFHIGAGDEKKMWDINKWKELTKNISKKNKIFFTGFGRKEEEIINEIIKKNINAKNLANKQSLKEFMNIIKNSKALVTVDSISAHVGAYFEVPSVVIYSSVNNSNHWIVKKDNVKVLEFDYFSKNKNFKDIKTLDIIDNLKKLKVLNV